jgi:hypothetical protein
MKGHYSDFPFNQGDTIFTWGYACSSPPNGPVEASAPFACFGFEDININRGGYGSALQPNGTTFDGPTAEVILEWQNSSEAFADYGTEVAAIEAWDVLGGAHTDLTDAWFYVDLLNASHQKMSCTYNYDNGSQPCAGGPDTPTGYDVGFSWQRAQ